jgi:hypothetical protein
MESSEDIDVVTTVKALYDAGVGMEQIETLYHSLDEFYAGMHEGMK